MVCTVEQAFTDVLRYVNGEEQTLIEALGDYYYMHNKSWKELTLPEDYQKAMEKYKYTAIHYWTY